MSKFAELNGKLDYVLLQQARILALLEERQGVGMSDRDAPVVSYPQPASVRPEHSVRLVPRFLEPWPPEGNYRVVGPIIGDGPLREGDSVTASPAWAKEDDPK